MRHWCRCSAEKTITISKDSKDSPQSTKGRVCNSKRNYDEFLRDNSEISVHQRHLRALICEVFKSLNDLNPEIMWLHFVFKNITYNIRNGPLLRLPAAKSTSAAQSMSSVEQFVPTW